MKELKDYITNIPDFPEKGIIFRDITSLLQDSDGFHASIDAILNRLKDTEFDTVVGLDARGFLISAPIAYTKSKNLVLVRKKGKLPRETISEQYDLEYGTAEVEIHKDAIKKGDRVIIIDDLIATGGTLEATVKLVKRLGGEVVKIVALIELTDLRGREKLKEYDVESIITYAGK